MNTEEFARHIVEMLQDPFVSMAHVIAQWNEAIEKKNIILQG